MGRKSEAVSNTMNDMAAFEKVMAIWQYNKVEYFQREQGLFRTLLTEFMDHGRAWT